MAYSGAEDTSFANAFRRARAVSKMSSTEVTSGTYRSTFLIDHGDEAFPLATNAVRIAVGLDESDVAFYDWAL
jgi:hypothetical protein